MARSIQERIESLLDQLESASLSKVEIQKIERKIEFLRTLEE